MSTYEASSVYIALLHKLIKEIIEQTFNREGSLYLACTSFVDLLWFFLSCVCYAFVCVCLYVPCGHLLGKG